MTYKPVRTLIALGVLSLGLVVSPLTGSAQAESKSASTWYQATLNPLNGSAASGWLTVELRGDTAIVHEEVNDLAGTFRQSRFRHLQSIRVNGLGTCPAVSADTNGDGVISTTEGVASYGVVGATLSVKGGTSPRDATKIEDAPAGPGYGYDRTIVLPAATAEQIRSGKAVVVVHGVMAARLSPRLQAAKSDVVPSLPLAVTLPALCGTLHLSQLGAIPTGGAQTGDGGSQPLDTDAWRAAAAASFALSAGCLWLWRRSAVRR